MESENLQNSNITSKPNIILAKCKKYYIKYLLPLDSLECSKKYAAIQNQSRLRTLTSLFVYEYLTIYLTEDITRRSTIEDWSKKHGRGIFLKDPNPIRRGPLDAFFKLTDLYEVYQDVASNNITELEAKPQNKVLVFGLAVLKSKTFLACVEAIVAKSKARFFHKLHRYSRSSMVALGHAKNWDTQYIRMLNRERKLEGEKMLAAGLSSLKAMSKKEPVEDPTPKEEPINHMDFSRINHTIPPHRLSFHDKMQELYEADLEASRNTPPCEETRGIVSERLASIVSFKHARSDSLDETKKTASLIDNLVEDSFDGITRSIRSVLIRHKERKRALDEAEHKERNRREIKTIELRKLGPNVHNTFRIPSFVPIALCEQCGLYVIDPNKCISTVPNYELETRARKQVAIEAIRKDVETLFTEYKRLIEKKQTVYQEQIESFFK
jgi:hypothetical protein